MEYEAPNQTTGKKEPGAKANVQHAIIPVTLLMAKRSRNYMIDHQEFQHLVCVAKLLRRAGTGGKHRLTFTDGTTDLEIILNVDEERSSEVMAYQLNRHYFIAFTPRQGPDDETKYFLDMIREVKDFNELSKHLSDVLVAHLERNHS